MSFRPWRIVLLPWYWKHWCSYTPPCDREAAKEVDAIIALTFGIGPNGQPGASNKQIAFAASHLHRVTEKPIIAQKEVYEAIRELGFVNMAQVEYIPGPNEKTEGVHYHSADSLQQATEVCARRKWGLRVSLVGNADHMPRVHWAWQKLGGTVVHVKTCNIGYCPDSTQLWCRRKTIFRIWELGGALPIYVLWNKI